MQIIALTQSQCGNAFQPNMNMVYKHSSQVFNSKLQQVLLLKVVTSCRRDVSQVMGANLHAETTICVD